MKTRAAVPRDCHRCRLSASRSNIVSGVGPRKCKIAFVGEAPGKDEDLRGEPFVGRAGKVLNVALTSAGVSRDDVFITNLVRCRPPNNRRPREDEKDACRGFLADEIAATGVDVICALGQTVAHELTGVEESMADIVGKEFAVSLFGRDYTVIAAYHPAACLYRRDKLPSFVNAVKHSLAIARIS